MSIVNYGKKGELAAIEWKASNPKIYNSAFKLSFHPEGGNLVSGYVNRVAVTIDNIEESPLPLKAFLVDDSEKRLLEFNISTLGLGELKFIPEYPKNYFVVIESKGNDQHQRFKLPTVLKKGLSLQMVPYDDHYRVNLKSSLHTNLKGFSYTIEQNNGLVLKGDIVKETKESIIKIPNKLLAKGVFDFTLSDKKDSIIARRMAFKQPDDDFLKMHVSALESLETNQDSLSLEISFNNSKNQPLSNTCFSIQKLNKFNIFLALASEENETEIFDDRLTDTERANHLDILMLASIKKPDDLLDGCGSILKKESYVTIAGLVKNIFTDKPLSNVYVGLYFKNKDVVGMDEAKTDADGRFSFTQLDFSENTFVLLQLKNSEKDKKSGFEPSDFMIELDSVKTFYQNHKNNFSQKTEASELKDLNISKTDKEKLDMMYLASRNLIALSNVDVDAEKKDVREEIFKSRRILYKNPSHTIDFAELPTNITINPLQALVGRVPGVITYNGQIFLRGINSLNAENSEPLILLDGMPVDLETGVAISGSDIPFDDVDFIDIIKGPKAAIYGSRASGGIIAVYTKTGKKGSDSSSEAKSYQISFTHPGIPVGINQKGFENNFAYQNPALAVESGTSDVIVKVPREPGYYLAILEGIDREGKPFYTKTYFKVKL
ncbi:TonB-dependent receptor plug domain-containing protein [Allomuricauda sp. d1]|uniref:TonB-dependent receptor plug domain-containing protein n=1 Tax=Allomuricauda sp. d1 TaxID=3136725 RepID=UPI0031DC97FD